MEMEYLRSYWIVRSLLSYRCPVRFLLHPLPLFQVDVSYCREKGIAVTNTPDVLTDDTADLAIALLLATMRQICSADRYVRKGCWPKQGDYPLSYKVGTGAAVI